MLTMSHNMKCYALGHYAVMAPKHATSLDQFLGKALRPLRGYANGAMLFAQNRGTSQLEQRPTDYVFIISSMPTLDLHD